MQKYKDLKNILDIKINESNQIFITGHNVSNNDLDFDAIASMICLYLIIQKYDKQVYLLIEELPAKIEPGVKKIIEEIRTSINIINVDKYTKVKSDNDLLITVDTNKTNLINCANYIDKFKDIIIIDHHNEDKNTINTDYKFIFNDVSSTSEILTELLLLYKIKYAPIIANYLLAGIYLDTNKYTRNCSARTMRNVTRLLDKGAEINKVNEYYEEDYVSDRKVQELVSKANFFTYSIAVCIGDENVTYTKEELAKVADYLLRYKADATFAAGYIDDEMISISARSKGNIDVGKIMSELEGGGNTYSAAAKLFSQKMEEVSQKLTKIIKPTFYKEDEIK